MMRTFLDEGVLDHEGEFYTCKGMFTSARPVQERMPIKIGAMRGPKSFEFAGEVTRRHAPGARLLARGDPVRRRPRAHRRRARGPRLDGRSTSAPGASPASPRTARPRASACACWSRSTSPRCRSSRCSATASTVAQTQPIFDAFASGDVEKAIELTTPDLVEQLSFSGTPEDVVEQIRANVVPTGIEPRRSSRCATRRWPSTGSGRQGDYAGVPHMKDQLQLIARPGDAAARLSRSGRPHDLGLAV